MVSFPRKCQTPGWLQSRNDSVESTTRLCEFGQVHDGVFLFVTISPFGCNVRVLLDWRSFKADRNNV